MKYKSDILSNTGNFRIMTELELIEKLGKQWNANIDVSGNHDGGMNYLFGRNLSPLKIRDSHRGFSVCNYKTSDWQWEISLDVVVEDTFSLIGYKNYSSILS